MSSYKDYPVKISDLPETITDKLAGVYSVEVVRIGRRALLRMWIDEHCDLAAHDKIEDD